MILAIDIGNTNVVLGSIEGNDILFEARMATDSIKTSDQYCAELKNILALFDVVPSMIDGQALDIARERCMMMLSSKLYQLEQERIESAVSSERRSQVGSGMRNEKIRTYNFPQSRVTDHRIGLTLYQLDSILNGGLDPILDALIAADQAEKLRRSESSDKS